MLTRVGKEISVSEFAREEFVSSPREKVHGR